jgi:predicted kinase
MQPHLIIFSGLPGTGKTTLAKEISKILKATYLRLDTIEQGLRDICSYKVQGEGYRLTYRIVEDNLRIGNDVIVDCCNPWKMTRDEWEKVAINNNGIPINIEIFCSDTIEHKKRVENRSNDITGFSMPTWKEVIQRNYEEWDKPRIKLDTANKSVQDCVELLHNEINKMKIV